MSMLVPFCSIPSIFDVLIMTSYISTDSETGEGQRQVSSVIDVPATECLLTVVTSI